MSDLRETLATRFESEFGPYECAGVLMPETEREHWLAVADECIRQMRWVAFQTAHSYRSSEGYEDKDDALADSEGYVTAAPDDWKPNETERST